MKQLIHALRHPSGYQWLALRPWRRHSLVLMLGGSIYVGIGLAYILTDTNPARNAALELPLNLMPMAAWGVLFVVVGAMGVISTRWPPASEKWGYTVMAALAALWGSFFLLGTLVLGTPASGITGGFIWYLLAFLWWAIAGLDNPADQVTEA